MTQVASGQVGQYWSSETGKFRCREVQWPLKHINLTIYYAIDPYQVKSFPFLVVAYMVSPPAPMRLVKVPRCETGEGSVINEDEGDIVSSDAP